MSGSTTIVSAIPASYVANVIPGVIGAGGTARELIGLMLTTSTRTPVGQVLSFPLATSVDTYYGTTSNEYADGQVYFNGFDDSDAKPAALLVTQYPTANVGAWLRGGNVSGLTLTQLQALNGLLIVTVDGTVETSASISLAGATSFTNAADLIATGLGVPAGPTQATFAGPTGATSTSCTGSGTTLTIAGTITGHFLPGDLLTAAGIPGSTTITSQLTGPTGGAGTYLTNNATTASTASLVGASFYTQAGSFTGTAAVGQQLGGSGVPSNTYLTAFPVVFVGLSSLTFYQFSNQFQVATESYTLKQPAVTYDGVSGGFQVNSSTTGATSTIGFATGSLSGSLSLTAAAGAVTSQGAAAAVPATFMQAVTAMTQNWGTFFLTFDPDNGSGNAQKLAFAAWVNGTQDGYMYVAKDTDVTPTQSTQATTSLGYILKQDDFSGTAPIWGPAGATLHHSAFLSGLVASIDFSETNGRVTAAFRSQTGLSAAVTDATTAANLTANGYNFYGALATTSQEFQFLFNGLVSGPYSWIDSYVNQIWLNSALQQAIVSFLTTYKSIPYNPAGYALIRAGLMDPINAAVNFGAIRQNVPLSSAQAAEVNAAAAMKIDGQLSTAGWYLLISPATAQVRAARGSPPMTLFYMDGQSVQTIVMSSILVK
jgi:hypothetical protein